MRCNRLAYCCAVGFPFSGCPDVFWGLCEPTAHAGAGSQVSRDALGFLRLDSGVSGLGWILDLMHLQPPSAAGSKTAQKTRKLCLETALADCFTKLFSRRPRR